MDNRKHDAIETQPLQYVNIDEPFQEIRTVSGFILPGGSTKLMVVSHNVSGEVFGIWRKQLNAKVFTVKVEAMFKANLDTYKEQTGYKTKQDRERELCELKVEFTALDETDRAPSPSNSQEKINMKLNTGERLLRIAQLEAELDITKDELSRAEANVSFYKTKAREIEFTIKVLKKEGEQDNDRIR